MQICNEFIFCIKNISNRYLASSAELKEAPVNASSAKKLENQSFVANFFSGKMESSQIFPYPYNLTEEQSETIGMVVEPFRKFFTVSQLTR